MSTLDRFFAMPRMATSYHHERRLITSPRQLVGLALAVVALVALPFVLQSRSLFGIPLTDAQLLGIGLPQINVMLIAIMGAIALNLLVGMTGLISLGQAAFFAVGAFSAALFGTQLGWPFLLVIVMAGLMGLAVGLLVGLPSLRLAGLYLMLATLALHFVVLFLFAQYQISFFSPAGIPFLPPDIFGWKLIGEVNWYWTLLVLVILLQFGVRALMSSRHGRSFIAVRDNEVAAAALGMNVARVRISSFALSSILVSILGALYAYYLGNIGESSFGLNFVIGYFAMILIGGMGSVSGPVFGAIVWAMLPQLLSSIAKQVPPSTPVIGQALTAYQGYTVLVVVGIVILLLLRFEPGGVNAYWQKLKGVFLTWPYRSKA